LKIFGRTQPYAQHFTHQVWRTLAKQSHTSDKVPRISLGPQPPSNSVEELEAALTKARDALACKQRTNPHGHLQSPDREASIDDLCNDI